MNPLLRTRLFFVFKLLIAVVAIFFILIKVNGHDYFPRGVADINSLLEANNSRWWLPAIFALMLLNWSSEAWKWKKLLGPVEEISFFRALGSVLSGLTVSFFTPNRVGEFAGRIMHLDEGFRVKGAMAAFVGNTAQLLITLQVGLIAAALFARHFIEIQFSTQLICIILSVSLATTALLFWLQLPELTVWLNKFDKRGRYAEFTAVFKSYESNELIAVYMTSLFRYVVFCSQQYLLFIVLGTHLPYGTLFGLSAISFLLITLIPTIALAELGVRGGINMAIFGTVIHKPSIILLCTFLLWLINLVVPSILGAISILYIKIVGDKQVNTEAFNE
jgi:hypothetical protein